MPIKIICNGDLKDTRIIDVNSGVELQDSVTKAVIMLDGKAGRPEVILNFTDVALEVTGEVVETFPPAGLTLEDVTGICKRGR